MGISSFVDDVTAASTSTASDKSPKTDSSDQVLDPVGQGPLLEKDQQGVVKLVNAYWEDAEPYMAQRIANWKANAARRDGVIGVHVVKPDPDRNEWKVWAPPGASKVPPTFNQPARLSRRLVANLFVDPPIPEATPGSASDSSDPDAAEFTTRILQDVCTAPKFHVADVAEECVSLAATYDSAFARVWVDPKGGGSNPKAIMASQQATSEADALYVNGDGVTPQPTPYVTRYIKDDGSLTDEASEATLDWLPGLRMEKLTGLNLRPIPATAEDIEDCSGVIIRTGLRLSRLRDQFPEEIEKLTTDELWELVMQRPPKSDVTLAPNERDLPVKKRDGEDDPPPDDATVVITSVYMEAGGEYPAGAYIVVAGTKRVLHRQKWQITVNKVPENLPIPVAQFKGWDEGRRTFYGYHLMHFLGPGNEVRAAALGGAIEHLDRFNRRKVFYTPQSLFQPKMGPAQQGIMVPIQQGTEPKTEEMPEYPRIGLELFDRATAELNDESGLAPVAQGMTDPSVQSGLHAQKIIEQVNIGLGGIKRSTDKGVVRLWSIATSFIRGYFTQPQQVRYRGDDQEYKQKEWSAADLGDTKDVRILKGSFSGLAPSAKLAVAQEMRKMNLIDDNQLRMAVSGNIGGLMGIQDDPALLRIRRQISLWEDGPPKMDTSPAASAFPGLNAQGNDPLQTALQEGQLAQVAPPIDAPPPTGAPDPNAPIPQDPSVVGSIPPAPGTPVPPMAPPAPPPDPVQVAFQNIFRPAANDEEPAISQIRFRELSRAMCGKKYERQPPEWRAQFDGVYEASRKAAGVGTTAEAAKNQQAAAQAQLQQAQQESQAKVAEATATNQARAQADQVAEAARSQKEVAIAQLKGQQDLEKTKLQLEHASIMKQAELAATPATDPEAQVAADLAKHHATLQQKHEQAQMEIKHKHELSLMELAQEATLAREKLKAEAGKASADRQHDLRKEKVKANPGLELVSEKKEIKIFREVINGKSVITGAEIIPVVTEAEPDATDKAESGENESAAANA